MGKHLIVVEDRKDWPNGDAGHAVVGFHDYLFAGAEGGTVKVINLCRSYRYLSSGYYCSLLAEARGHRVVPSVRTINDLRSRALYGLDLDALQPALDRLGKKSGSGKERKVEFRVLFGQTEAEALGDLARQVFEVFPVPILQVTLRHAGTWIVDSVRPESWKRLGAEEQGALQEALRQFITRSWRRRRASRAFRYDLAILVSPEEKLPPSNRTALQNFIQAGRALDIDVELIQKRDFGKLAEYDGLFIRETTAVSDHTYRFAKKAESEEMVVIDDPLSILRCTNKIYLADLLKAHKVPAPRTLFLSRSRDKHLAAQVEELGFPVVLKIPDGSFSRGVEKAGDPEELERLAARLFHHSSVLLAQEYLFTDYDWRIGVLDRKPLYACRYYMSKGHWQIYKHGASGQIASGESETLLVQDAPPAVVSVALAAANLIGDGFYGVDVKQAGDQAMVVEVNDNPSIDAGYEDAALGKELYRLIMAELLRRMEARRSASERAGV